jgi:predicted metallopeptidase
MLKAAESAAADRFDFSPAAFDFTDQIRAICRDMTSRLAELRHIDMDRVAVCYCQARKRVEHGLFASLTPLRFAGGNLVMRRRGKDYTLERVFDRSGREMLYVLSMYLPRFMDLDFQEKLITIVHELWHVGPAFDGDIRRHAGRCYAHSGSQKQYDAHAGQLANRWLALNPPETLWRFLTGSFEDLTARHGRIVGMKIRRPRLIPVASPTGN